MNKKIRVLIVEDSKDDALLAAHEIRHSGYDPEFEMVDTPEAMSSALDKQTWDIVLADYGIPHFSGEAALGILKDRGIDLPFIIVSGKIGEEKAVELIKKGAQDVIMKDRPLRLVPAIERALHDAGIKKRQGQAEASLRESEEKYRLLVQNIDEAIYAVDIREDIFKGDLIILSSQVEKITGYGQDEFMNDTGLWFNSIHPDDVKQVVEDTKKLVEKKKKVTRFYRIRHKTSGEFRWLEDRIVPKIDDGGNVTSFFGVVRDITERRKAEEEISSMAKFPAENPNPVLRISRDKTVLYKNEAFNRLLEESGLTDADTFKLLPEGLDNLIDQSLKDGYSRSMLEVSAGGKVFSYNFAPMSEHGYVNLYGRDITERKQAMISLKASEDKFRAYFENAPFGYQSLDENGCFIDVNDAWLETLQYTREEVIGRPFADSIAPEYAEKFRKSFPCFKKEGEIQGVEFKMIRRDGTHVLMSINGKIGYDEHGNLKQTHCILQDITERKKLEDQLMRFHKMEALGQLARGIAHDFNNILAALSGYGNLLKIKIKKDKSSTHTIDQILSLTDRATGLTQNLLAFNRDRMINPKPENLNELIKRSKKILSRILNKHVKLKIVFTDRNLTVMIDSGQMENVLINLATNARDAMPEEGLLTIKTELAEIGRGDVTHFSHEKPGRYALMTVTDTGIGMDEKTKEKIFELFYTTKSSDKGMGLGASIVREIIRRNNGHITVESSPGKGTTFKIYLPLAEKEVEEIRIVPPVARVSGAGTILLAEDDLEFRGMIRSVLEEFSYEVIEAVDGQDAIDKFRKNKDRIQLILLESVMPKKNAPEVYTEARNIRPDVKALLMSGYGEDILRKKGISVEGVVFLLKPVSPQELLNKVKEVLVN